MSAAVLNAAMVSDLPAPGDAELVERFVVARDHAAFAELVHRHSDVVLGVCRRVLHDTHDIDDVFQATFLVFVRDATRVRKRKSLASWLYGVAYRLSLRVARQKRRRRETILVDDNLIDGDTLEKLADRHDQQLVDIELNALPERYRQPLVLRYLAGKSSSEVASELGMTVGAVDGLIKRGKDELRTRLLRRGITLGTALVAVQVTQQAAQAAGTDALIEATIQASLAWDFGSNAPTPDLISDRAIELAGKELFVMTTASKAALAVGLTLGGLAVGLGGASVWSGPGGGNAEAAGIVTTLSVSRAANNGVELATLAADPTVKESSDDSTLYRGELLKGHSQIGLQVKSDTAQPKATHPPQVKWDFKSRSANVVRIENALSDPTEVAFTDQPFNDALEYLEDLHHVEIWIDLEALNDAGIASDQNVNLVMSGISFRSALRLLLDPLKLDYVIKNEVMVITSHEKAHETFETRVYNVGLLPEYSPKELMEIILATVDPEGWNLPVSNRPAVPTNEMSPKMGAGVGMMMGGPAAGKSTPTKKDAEGNSAPALPTMAGGMRSMMTMMGGMGMSGGGMGGGGHFNDGNSSLGVIRATSKTLVIRQTQRIHEEIVELLDQLK